MRLNHEELMHFMAGVYKLAARESQVKNLDYANTVKDGPTGLANFYDAANEFGITPLQALGVHARKHNLALRKVINGGKLASEGFMGRVIDQINYTALLAALHLELESNAGDDDAKAKIESLIELGKG